MVRASADSLTNAYLHCCKSPMAHLFKEISKKICESHSNAPYKESINCTRMIFGDLAQAFYVMLSIRQNSWLRTPAMFLARWNLSFLHPLQCQMELQKMDSRICTCIDANINPIKPKLLTCRGRGTLTDCTSSGVKQSLKHAVVNTWPDKWI